VGRYEVRRELGRGMMGVVYEAHDPVLGRDIALKVIQVALGVSDGERESYERRFFAEARAAARLTHAGIVVVHDVGRDANSGALFMALELLRGRPLDAVLRERGRLEWREALTIARRLAEALHHAHTHGVVHRDVKPANIMLLESGEPKIMDFGIAKLEASQLTASGQFLGTPLYMSPEQAMAHPVDARSDVFSLGAVLYEMLTGRQAFGGESVTKILFQIMSREPQPPTSLAPGLPESADYVLARTLAKDVNARYPDARTLAEDMDDVLSGRPARGRASWRLLAGSGTVVAPASGTLVGAPPSVGAPPIAGATAAPPAEPGFHAARVPQASSAPASARGVGAATQGSSSASRGDFSPKVAWAGGAAAVLLLGGLLLFRPGAPTTPDPVARRVSPPATEAPRIAARPEQPASPAADESKRAGEPRAGAEAYADQTAAAADGPARLLVDFEHSLKSGILRVWVDDEEVLEEEFGGRVTKEIAGLKLRKGRLSEALEVKPGRRDVKVQVDWDDNTKVKTARSNFKPGTTYRLKAKLGSLGGLRKDLSLEWY
jgi:serine/threonine-protein kinase